MRTGFAAGHGAAAGPMTPVTQQLAAVPDADVHAIAVYISALMPHAPASPISVPRPSVTADARVAAMFEGACGACHGANAPMTRGGAPSLSLATAVNQPTQRNVVDVILHGLPWQEGHVGPYMPAFGDLLTDAQVAALANFVRAHYSDQPAWHDVEATVRSARREGGGR